MCAKLRTLPTDLFTGKTFYGENRGDMLSNKLTMLVSICPHNRNLCSINCAQFIGCYLYLKRAAR